MKQKVVLVDDHSLLRNGLAGVVQDLGYEVLFEADHGKDLQQKLDRNNLPDFVLLDINMKEMDGYETALWLKNTYPLIKILALSMYDDENAILKMLKNGARGYILKDSEPGELRGALEAIATRGYYYSELVTGKLIHSINKSDDDAAAGNISKLNERELQFAHDHLELPRAPEAFCRAGSKRYGWTAACVTFGSRGCAMLVGDDYVISPGVPVRVADPVGAGDAFAAALVHGLASAWPAARIAAFANRVGASVAGTHGAIPDVVPADPQA